ncbi:MAG TPA: aromatic prenyltransferase [Trebonia sp.]|nr:aromatic prenyltransferase [Trebonia sp.]
MTAPATQPIDLGLLRSDLRRYADIAGVPFDAPAVDRVIAPLTDLFTTDFWVGIRTTTKPAGSRDVNLRLGYTRVPPIPRLREAGLLAYQGHPIERLADQIERRFAVGGWGVDTSVKGVADKVWLAFPERVPLADLMSLPDLPPAVTAARAHFDRAGMDRVGLIGLDFTSHTINLYGPVFPPGTLTAAQVEDILAGLGFPLPPGEELQRNARAFNLYQTFKWDSPDILRLCFPIMCTAAEFPTHYHPLLKEFADHAPMLDSAARDFILYTTYGPRGRYYKVQADYTGNHRALYPHHYGSSAVPPQC